MRFWRGWGRHTDCIYWYISHCNQKTSVVLLNHTQPQCPSRYFARFNVYYIYFILFYRLAYFRLQWRLLAFLVLQIIGQCKCQPTGGTRGKVNSSSKVASELSGECESLQTSVPLQNADMSLAWSNYDQ